MADKSDFHCAPCRACRRGEDCVECRTFVCVCCQRRVGWEVGGVGCCDFCDYACSDCVVAFGVNLCTTLRAELWATVTCAAEAIALERAQSYA